MRAVCHTSCGVTEATSALGWALCVVLLLPQTTQRGRAKSTVHGSLIAAPDACLALEPLDTSSSSLRVSSRFVGR